MDNECSTVKESCSTESLKFIPLQDLISLLKKYQLLQSGSEFEKSLIEMSSDSRIKHVDFTQPWKHSDLRLIVEDKPIHVSKMILEMWSPVFRAMFENDFKEKTANEVALPGKKFVDILELALVIHPPNKELTCENSIQLLPLLQEYQIDALLERAEDCLCNQSSSVKLFVVAQKYNLTRLHDSMLSYLKRAPMSRLKTQPDFDQLDQSFLIEILTEKLDKFETSIESLREVRMVLERKKPTTFPGMHLLCESCAGAREQQVDCSGCMKSCCQRLTVILRNMEA